MSLHPPPVPAVVRTGASSGIGRATALAFPEAPAGRTPRAAP